MRGVQRASMHLLWVSLVLVGLGIVMVYSSSSVLAKARYGNSSFFLERQLIRAGIGLVVMFVLSRVPTPWLAKAARGVLAMALILLILVLVVGVGPAERWLRLPLVAAGFSFQPSEFAKLALVLYLADVLVRREGEMGDFKKGLLPRLLVVGLVMALIVFQPNLGTGLAVGIIAAILLWVGGARLRHLLGVGMALLPLVLVSLLSFGHQMKRLREFIDGGNYQVEQSLVALGSGGWLGVGLGNSLQKQQFLPEPHTDFAFALVGEELGLVGTLGVMTLFAFFAFQGMRIAFRAATYHGFLLATGITAMISVYALLNVGVVTGLLPTTGLPLPFISYGGSSLLWNLAGVGILLGVARTSTRHPGELLPNPPESCRWR